MSSTGNIYRLINNNTISHQRLPYTVCEAIYPYRKVPYFWPELKLLTVDVDPEDILIQLTERFY